MVELLLKKKVQVNCQLDSVRHLNLTPLHIACGCLSSNTIDVTRQLLEHGAHVNAESLPDNKEYLSLTDPLITDMTKMVNRLFFLLIIK
jgi:ankyrin repeat protein